VSSPAAHSALAPIYRTGSFGKDTSAGATLVLAERRPGSMINVQGEPDSTIFLDAVKQRFGVGLPQEPNTSAATGSTLAHWLGPNSWLIVGPALPPDEIKRRHDAITAARGALIDVSSGRVVLRIQGAHGAGVLAKNCGLDFHPRRFAVGGCAQSLYGRIAVLIHKFDAAPGFDLFAARSYAGSLWHELTHAADEYGYRVDPPVQG
jgi:sarcosine oxidase subunit gamma